MSEVPDCVPGTQPAFPLTYFCRQRRRPLGLPAQRHEAVVSPVSPSLSPSRQRCLRWVCPQALFPVRGSRAVSATWRPQSPTWAVCGFWCRQRAQQECREGALTPSKGDVGTGGDPHHLDGQVLTRIHTSEAATLAARW